MTPQKASPDTIKDLQTKAHAYASRKSVTGTGFPIIDAAAEVEGGLRAGNLVALLPYRHDLYLAHRGHNLRPGERVEGDLESAEPLLYNIMINAASKEGTRCLLVNTQKSTPECYMYLREITADTGPRSLYTFFYSDRTPYERELFETEEVSPALEDIGDRLLVLNYDQEAPSLEGIKREILEINKATPNDPIQAVFIDNMETLGLDEPGDDLYLKAINNVRALREVAQQTDTCMFVAGMPAYGDSCSGQGGADWTIRYWMPTPEIDGVPYKSSSAARKQKNFDRSLRVLSLNWRSKDPRDVHLVTKIKGSRIEPGGEALGRLVASGSPVSTSQETELELKRMDQTIEALTDRRAQLAAKLKAKSRIKSPRGSAGEEDK